MEEEDDARREAAMAATDLLQPNFQSSSISHTQLCKLMELRRRRLQIKKNSSNFKKMKGKTNGERTNVVGEAGGKKDIIQTEFQQSVVLEESFPCARNECRNTKNMKENASLPRKQQQKLHWGLDTKERWERKGNM